MNIKKTIFITYFLMAAITASAMKYQIKVLNTPTITIDNKKAKAGDWFDDQSKIVWSKDNQAMRVLSEDNKVYTISAKLYKESKSKTFSDFVIYTKPLAARGANNDSLIAKLQERFDNDFIMLDQIVIDLSDICLPKGTLFHFSNANSDIADSDYFEAKITDGNIIIARSSILSISKQKTEEIKINVLLGIKPHQFELVCDSFEIIILPISLD